MSAPAAAAAASGDRGKAFIAVLACVLSRLVQQNDSKPTSTKDVVTKFHALRPPTISIRDYLERINKYAGCSPECFVMALVYIDRLIAKGGLELTSMNVHRVLITAVLLAAKFFDDQYYNNAYFAKVGGVPCNEINTLELEMLFYIGFSLHVPTDVYEKYFMELAGHCLVPPAVAAHTHTCDCTAYAALLTFSAEDVRHSGLRADLVAAAAAAVASGGGRVERGGGSVSPVLGGLGCHSSSSGSLGAAAGSGGHMVEVGGGAASRGLAGGGGGGGSSSSSSAPQLPPEATAGMS